MVTSFGPLNCLPSKPAAITSSLPVLLSVRVTRGLLRPVSELSQAISLPWSSNNRPLARFESARKTSCVLVRGSKRRMRLLVTSVK